MLRRWLIRIRRQDSVSKRTRQRRLRHIQMSPTRLHITVCRPKAQPVRYPLFRRIRRTPRRHRWKLFRPLREGKRLRQRQPRRKMPRQTVLSRQSRNKARLCRATEVFRRPPHRTRLLHSHANCDLPQHLRLQKFRRRPFCRKTCKIRRQRSQMQAEPHRFRQIRQLCSPKRGNPHKFLRIQRL